VKHIAKHIVTLGGQVLLPLLDGVEAGPENAILGIAKKAFQFPRYRYSVVIFSDVVAAAGGQTAIVPQSTAATTPLWCQRPSRIVYSSKKARPNPTCRYPNRAKTKRIFGDMYTHASRQWGKDKRELGDRHFPVPHLVDVHIHVCPVPLHRHDVEVPPEGSRVDPVVAAGTCHILRCCGAQTINARQRKVRLHCPKMWNWPFIGKAPPLSVVLTPSLAPAEREAVRKSRHDGRARLLPLPNLIELFRRLPRRGEGVGPEARNARAGDAAALVADLDRNVFLPLREDDRYRGHLVPVVLVPVRARL